jgi:Cobalamin synthesis protein cobW C-terminal domain/Phage integrase family
LQCLNPSAKLTMASFGQVAPGDLFSSGFFDLERKSREVRDLLDGNARHSSHDHPPDTHEAVGQHQGVEIPHHAPGISSFCIELDEGVAWEDLCAWYSGFSEKCADRLLRVKGIINVRGSEAPALLHCVQATMHEPTSLASWPDDQRQSRIVFITRDLSRDMVESSLRAYLANPHRPSESELSNTRSRTSAAAAAHSERWLNQAELGRIFGALRQQTDGEAADALRFMLLTGISQDELRTIRWDDFDLDRGVWLRRHASRISGFLPPRSRRVPLHSTVAALLESRREARSGEDLLFPGLERDLVQLESTWSAVSQRAGLEIRPLHTLAPTLATALFDGLDAELVRALLGLGPQPRPVVNQGRHDLRQSALKI